MPHDATERTFHAWARTAPHGRDPLATDCECEGTGWIETDDGAVRCSRCIPEPAPSPAPLPETTRDERWNPYTPRPRADLE